MAIHIDIFFYRLMISCTRFQEEGVFFTIFFLSFKGEFFFVKLISKRETKTKYQQQFVQNYNLQKLKAILAQCGLKSFKSAIYLLSWSPQHFLIYFWNGAVSEGPLQ